MVKSGFNSSSNLHSNYSVKNAGISMRIMWIFFWNMMALLFCRSGYGFTLFQVIGFIARRFVRFRI